VDRAKRLPTILVNSFPGEGASSSDSDRYDLPPGQRILHVGPLFNSNSNDSNMLEARAENAGSSCGFPYENSKSTAAAACTMWQADSTCMDWLDRQSPGSVVYVSFGSWVAPIGPEKIAEFALSLQAAGRPFLWVLKNHTSWRAGLPDGFVETVVAGRGTGKIVLWAPQEEVLSHHAVGCYITHCGWNSTLEAVKHRVRMICYPISGDQFINCAYIVKIWEAGIAMASTDRNAVKDCVERSWRERRVGVCKRK